MSGYDDRRCRCYMGAADIAAMMMLASLCVGCSATYAYDIHINVNVMYMCMCALLVLAIYAIEGYVVLR